MNMLAAARITATILGCKHAECPRPVLCSERCFELARSRQWAADQAQQLNAECEEEIERLHGKPL